MFLPHIQSSSFPGVLTPTGEAFVERSVLGNDPKPAQVLVMGTGALKSTKQSKSGDAIARIDEFTETVEENGEEA